ncbi:Hypp7093 [Branchiostoma lanceolatum]|uniref:Hypp7093 protein n=1 Tax=Branchiostoma lanceolatum TaxID=7740 RepID=A0A8J9YXF7_BRALA|nr:Hypp7093 [Branchiostoma lanceolatum]
MRVSLPDTGSHLYGERDGGGGRNVREPAGLGMEGVTDTDSLRLDAPHLHTPSFIPVNSTHPGRASPRWLPPAQTDAIPPLKPPPVPAPARHLCARNHREMGGPWPGHSLLCVGERCSNGNALLDCLLPSRSWQARRNVAAVLTT